MTEAGHTPSASQDGRHGASTTAAESPRIRLCHSARFPCGRRSRSPAAGEPSDATRAPLTTRLCRDAGATAIQECSTLIERRRGDCADDRFASARCSLSISGNTGGAAGKRLLEGCTCAPCSSIGPVHHTSQATELLSWGLRQASGLQSLQDAWPVLKLASSGAACSVCLQLSWTFIA